MTGRCLCGAVRFEIPDEIERIAQCHCASCKKLSGGGSTVNARVPSHAIRILAGEDLLRTYQPDEGSSKTFCSVCGSNLFGAGWPDSETASVRVTTLDQPPQRTPDLHIYVRSTAPWETLPDDGVPRFDERSR